MLSRDTPFRGVTGNCSPDEKKNTSFLVGAMRAFKPSLDHVSIIKIFWLPKILIEPSVGSVVN